ncbi:hypothetical protein HOG98_07140 [bacterium]|jgi:hypothetical protein|nr:hypothetical protein [bacterium]
MKNLKNIGILAASLAILVSPTMANLEVSGLFPLEERVKISDFMNNVSVGGSILGGLNLLTQSTNSATNRYQFDYAANIDFETKLAPGIKAYLQLQTSPGNGTYGFPGPGAELTDIGIEYTNRARTVTVVVGSYDTPFGQQTGMLSNNADTFNNNLIINPLLYSAFAGPMGTLNTLGAMINWDSSVGTSTLAISNGTDESATNPDGQFELVIGQSLFIEEIKTELSGTYMRSNDIKNATSGFSSDFQGWMVDGISIIGTSTELIGSYSQLTYGDEHDGTEDKVTSIIAEARHNVGDMFVSGRVSTWIPEDNDGSGAGMSSTLPNPAFNFGATVSPDQTITRYELGIGYFHKENVLLKAEWVLDNYEKETAGQETDVSGLLLIANVRF